jgi:hypothetical protein
MEYWSNGETSSLECRTVALNYPPLLQHFNLPCFHTSHYFL